MRFSILMSAMAMMSVSTVLASPIVQASTPTELTDTTAPTCTASPQLTTLLTGLINLVGTGAAATESILGNLNNIIEELTTNTAVEEQANHALGSTLTAESTLSQALALIQTIALLLGAKLP